MEWRYSNVVLRTGTVMTGHSRHFSVAALGPTRIGEVTLDAQRGNLLFASEKVTGDAENTVSQFFKVCMSIGNRRLVRVNFPACLPHLQNHPSARSLLPPSRAGYKWSCNPSAQALNIKAWFVHRIYHGQGK